MSWRERAAENIREGRWVHKGMDRSGPFGRHDVQEAEFRGRLHPRNRRGQFVDTPDILKPTEFVTRQDRSDLERARAQGLNVRLDTKKGDVIEGGVRSLGPETVTVEDRDGIGHRVAWEDIHSTSVGFAQAETHRVGESVTIYRGAWAGKTGKITDTRPNGGTAPGMVTVATDDGLEGLVDRRELVAPKAPPDAAAANEGRHTGPILNDNYGSTWRTFDANAQEVAQRSGVDASSNYSPEVQAIRSPKDAEGVLAAHGVDADFRLPDTSQGHDIAADTGFFRQITQAVLDAQERYPVLKDGPIPFKQIRFYSNATHRPEELDNTMRQQIWGLTGVDLDDPASQWNPNDNDPKTTGVVLFDSDQYGFTSRDEDVAKDWQTSVANKTPYGRMMHELGHAVRSAAGRSTPAARDAMIDDLVAAGLTPVRAKVLSQYGSSSPDELWAEIFTTLNTPGAYDTFKTKDGSKATVEGIEKLRKSMSNTQWGKLL